MKKRIIINISIILTILICLFLIFKFLPFGNTTYKNNNTSINFDIPKFSYLKNEYDNHFISFQSFRSVSSLKKDINKILRKYQLIVCNNETQYYNHKENLTILKYELKKGIFLNTINIQYEKGKKDNNECNKVTNPKKMKYQMKRCPDEICYGTNEFKYLHKNGNTYPLYYENDKFLLFQNGMNKMGYFNNMLGYEWISMQDILDFLDYQSEKKFFTKIIIENEQAILYKNNDFVLLQCKNKKIYIENPNFKYKSDYCQ